VLETNITFNGICLAAIMSQKKMIMLGMVIGSIAGGYLPAFFGAGELSMTSLLAGLAGGIAGIWIAYKFTS
jgi:hypothetical protein